MNEQEKIKVLYSWPVIILTLWLFWPVGIFLIIRRVSIDKNGLTVVALLLNIFAIVLYVFTAFMVLCVGICLFDMSDPSNVEVFPIFLITGILCGVGGYVSQMFSKKMKREAEEIKNYLSIIESGNERQIDVIASLVGKPVEVTKNEIQKIIQKGYLKNAYIDERTRELVYSNSVAGQWSANTTGTGSADRKPKVVTCSCCGANNTIIGGMGECEYCGSPLK